LVVIPALLLIAALFAAAEASLFSLSRPQLETMRLTRPAVYRRIQSFLLRPDSLLSTIIIGNECINIAMGTFVVELLESYFAHTPDRILAPAAIIISTVLMLMVSEILPKIVAFRLPVMIASILALPIAGAHWLLTPLRKIFLFISTRIIQLFGIKAEPPSAVSEKDFLTLVEVGAESGSLNRDEKEMISNVFHFSDLPVSSVMTPWTQVFHIKEGVPLDQVLQLVKEKTYSRIPVVSEKDDRVVGILYTKELFKTLLNNSVTPEEGIKNAIFLPYIVSSHKKISKLFREFKTKKVHIALVVDEYGHQLGVVTLEDLLNALFRTKRKTEEVART